MILLPRRVISLVVVVCFAGTPSLLLACAAICVPGMLTHGAMPVAAADAVPAAEAAAHEHMHHAMPAGHSASAPAATPRPDATVVQVNLASSSNDVVGPDCCAHPKTGVSTAPPAARTDIAALIGPGTVAVLITVPAVRDAGRVRATLVGQALLFLPPRSPLVLRI